MNAKKFERLKKNYLETPVPAELDFVVQKALKENGANMSKNNRFKVWKVVAASLAASLVILAIGVNTSPVFAQTMLKVPIIGSLVEVLTFREYTLDEDRFKANIKVPAISGFENKNLENSLNEKYLEENEKLYAHFLAEMEEMKEKGDGNLGVDSSYFVKTDTDRILSIGRYVVITMASGAEKIKYDTIDKEKEIIITLPSLFKDDSYVEVISENIKEQMREQMKSDEGKIYWVELESKEKPIEIFEKILPSQSFYISAEGKLVISFDEYEVAPGYMGVVEFVIPTEVIADILVGTEYIN